MSYDERCYELAKVFLSDFSFDDADTTRATLADELAQDIQRAIESFIAGHDLDNRFGKKS